VGSNPAGRASFKKGKQASGRFPLPQEGRVMNAPSTPLHVLVIEDDIFFQRVIEEALALFERPLLLTKAKDLSSGLEHIRQNDSSFDLALIDLGLPDGDGISIIRKIHARFPSTTILVISGGSEESRVLDAIRAGATGYVLKGDGNLSLHQALELVLKGLSPISPMLAGYFLKLAGREPDASPAKTLKLTRREVDLLEKFAQGMSYQEAAQQMGVALSTVQTHTRGLYRKMGVRSSLQALSKAKQHGLL
jgi:two-component system, NarL family, nitrate/nitrite response regulator NarL